MHRPPLRGLVAGLGVMGSHHARVLSAAPSVELVALVDPADDRRAAAELLHPRAGFFASLSEALPAVEPEFVCLAVPVEQLPELAVEAIDAGVPVLAEKPLARSEEEALRILRAAAERRVLLSVGHVERFNPAVAALKALLHRDDAGRIYQIHARRLSPFPFRESTTGVALDLATHDLDVIRYLTDSEIDRVHAETACRRPNAPEDLLSASVRLSSGTTGVLEVNWLTPAKIRELSVTTEAGLYVVNYLTQDLFFYENPPARVEWDALALVRGTGEGNMTRFALERREPLRQEWESFLAAVRGEAP